MTFDPVAPFYDILARLAFGRSLIRAQEWGIDQVRSGSRVLVLGGGTGATLPYLLARQPSHITFVDASAAMLQRARQRTQLVAAPITFMLGTEADVPATEPVDVILLPFVLDLYSADTLQAHMLPQLLRLLSADGQLVVTDFDQPRTVWQRAYVWLMLRFFNLTTSIVVRQWTNWPDALRRSDLVEKTGRSFRRGQVRSGCWVRAR